MAVTNLISHDKPRSGWVDVTPELAAAILSEGSRNRNIRRKDVIRYAADMKQGLWATTGEAIKFDQDGSLLDGQHRLSAVVDAQITVPMLFVYDIPRASQDVMDSGRRRSLADQLAMRGAGNCNRLAAAIKAAHSLEICGKPNNVTYASVVTLLDWFESNRAIVDSIAPIRKAMQPPVLYPGGLAAGIHYTMAKLASEEADRFWHILGSGDYAEGVQPILKLREEMMKRAAATGNGAVLQANHRAAYTIKAWNAWIEGREIKNFRHRAHLNDAFPVLIDPEGI